ncbi:MAG: beta-lactamase class C family [Verrucomicrobia bacterium]|nr:MAG: beta-lactamase class C family [Verrucomicrobiota bacterium]
MNFLKKRFLGLGVSGFARLFFFHIAACDGIAGSELVEKLEAAVENGRLPGAVVLVAQKDRVLALEAVGYADLALKKPMQVDDLFWIASMSKAVTAAAFMMLVDEGWVGLEDPVQKYLPEFSSLKVAGPDGTLVPPSHPVRIREILSHTGGMRFLNTQDRQKIDSVPLAVSIQHNLLEPLVHEPGTHYLYSNEGTDTAGRIIEVVSGIPYETFLQKKLLAPLGMTDTSFNPSAAQLKRLAKSYKTNAETGQLEEVKIPYLTYPLDSPERYPSPGGGLFSTAADVARFCRMLANGGTLEGKTYLSEESVRQMTTKQTGDAVAEKYGFCLKVEKEGVYGHGGAFQTSMTVEQGVVRVFLVQHTGKWAGGDPSADFAQVVRSLYPQRKP